MSENSKNRTIGIRITKELEENLEQKAKEYGIGKCTISSLCLFAGFFSLLKVEDQIDQISNRKDIRRILKQLANNEDIGAFGWNWSIKYTLIPAIKKMSVEEFLINGLKTIKLKKQEQEEKIKEAEEE